MPRTARLWSYNDPPKNLMYIFPDMPEVGMAGYEVVKTNGKKTMMPLVDENHRTLPIKIKRTKKGKRKLVIKYWVSCEMDEYMRQCFGLWDKEPVGPVLKEIGIFQALRRLSVSKIRYVLAALHGLQPSNIFMAQRAVQSLLTHDHSMRLLGNLYDIETIREHAAYTDELVKLTKIYKGLTK